MAKHIVQVNCHVLVTRTVEVEAPADEDPLTVQELGVYKAQSTGKRKDWSENPNWEDGEHFVTELKAGHSWCASRHSVLDADGNEVSMAQEYPDHG